MAFGRLERRAAARPMSDINMTPLIDVMLVLLVIFMVAAPLMTTALKLELPGADAGPAEAAAQALSVSLDAAGVLYVGDERVDGAALDARLAAAAAANPAAEVLLRADRGVPYGRVAALIAALQKAGLHRIAFVTEPDAAR